MVSRWTHTILEVYFCLTRQRNVWSILRRSLLFFMAADEWLWNFNLWSVITPKSFISFRFTSMWSFIWYDRLVLSLPICKHLHFCSLIGNGHIVNQFTKQLISSCNDVGSSSVLIIRYNFVSSANSLQQFVIANGGSFLNITKGIGPRTDP